MHSPAEQFREAISRAGLTPPGIVEADGKLRRFASNGKRGDDTGWYVLHSDGVPAGAFGDWRTGISETWRANIGRALSIRESADHQARVEAMRAQREKEETARAADAANEAARIWRQASPAGAHPYLERKGIKAHGVKLQGGRLVIPMRIGGTLTSLQFIDAEGEKLFLPGGKVAGAYFPIGNPDAGAVLIAEGFATGATLHEATGYAVAVAFNAGNLESVAVSLREKFPEARLILCADDDYQTHGNPGKSKAEAAARRIGGLVAVPEFGAVRPEGATDFNDLARHAGLEAVRQAVEGAAHPVNGEPGTLAGADALTNGETRIELLHAAAITPEAVSWLWNEWLARGKLHILAGAPGTGKTTIALAIAATLSHGGRWPDGTRAEAGQVLMWSGEDDPTDTLVPRLHACGADLTRIHFVGDAFDSEGRRPFDPARDMPQLQAAAERMGGASLLIVDPVVSAVAGDSHKNGETRRALQPLVDLAARLGCAVLGISHFSKGSAGKDPVERVTGSLAFGALARMVLAAAKLPDSEGGEPGGRLLARAKSNIGPDSGGFRYDLEQVELEGFPGVKASRLLWRGAVEGSARELLAEVEQSAEGRGEIADAESFLSGLLADGPVSARQVRGDAEGAGYVWRTVQEAAKRLRVERRKEGMKGGWVWALTSPPKMQGAPKVHEDASLKSLHLRASSSDAETVEVEF